jgi:hypothetical protein
LSIIRLLLMGELEFNSASRKFEFLLKMKIIIYINIYLYFLF